jgi:flagellar biosynthesis/type III secretory pathway protein FliH
MSDAARREFQMLPQAEKFFSEAQRRSFDRGKAEGKEEGRAEGKEQGRAEGKEQGRAEGKEQGRAEGEAKAKAEMLLRGLTQRGLAVSEAHQRQILDCGDQAALDRWWDRALAITSIEQLFA